MVINGLLREAIESRFGERIEYTYQCMALEEAIFQATGERLGLSTLKRVFGFVSYTSLPRKSTLDILARYAGYVNYEEFLRKNGDTSESSGFFTVESLEADSLKPGDTMALTYHPDRKLSLAYLGAGRFRVTESFGSKLAEGDVIALSQLAIGFPFVAADVERDGKSLGGYVGAKQGGIVTLKVKS